MSDFNLRQLVRDVLTSSTMADPRDLAAEVFHRIDPADYSAGLTQCLPDIVREQIRMSRNAVTPAALAELPSIVREAPRRLPARSAKVEGIRDWWKERLRERLSVGPNAADWRMLGDCSAADLDFAAADRRTIAAKTLAKAAEYAELAEAVRVAGVERVRDLPADVLRARLAEGQAA